MALRFFFLLFRFFSFNCLHNRSPPLYYLCLSYLFLGEGHKSFSLKMSKCIVSILFLLNVTRKVQWNPGVEGLLLNSKPGLFFFFFQRSFQFCWNSFIRNCSLYLFLLRDSESLFLVDFWFVIGIFETPFYAIKAHFKTIFRKEPLFFL